MVHALSALAAIAALASTAVAAPAVVEPRVSCASGVYMIVARGTGEAVGEGKPGQVAALVAARVPGSASVAVDYPASALRRRAANVIYPASVTAGINDTKKKIQDYVAQCGAGSKIALIGYSQGGNVMTDLLVGGVLKPAPLDDKYHKNIIAVTVFGDPTFAPNQSYDYGSNAHGSGGIFSRENNAGELAKLNAMAGKLASYCDAGDVVCADGSDSSVHGAEVATHAQEAADFIVARAH
ncbi:hypothetical protein LMH87_006059 [Akanthomyces muscarius]|uniref:Acetylxylan esterase n=1 Tax=Akanthomyces muscarius TaxID=2231603 RepID=A0A9W8QN15_AKAMU|nr:hypothetical protein LMH87_006059 [Akanthomyces muscarius]KAJ4164383.1 hypothetical protein LMH87_006059 [Akanthomyces muscarius]